MSNYISEWRQREVIEAVRAQVATNMAAAVKVVESDAQQRLLRVKEPEWGRKYRMILALYRLTSFVVQEGTLIEGRIGIPRGEKGSYHGYYIEIGSSTAPAHPWLRPALFTNLRDLVRIVGGGG